MSQFSQVELNPDKEIKNNLKVELKNENYETELATQDLETKLQSQNQKLLEKSNDFDIQENQINLSQAREFIQNIPNLDPKNVESLTEIGIQAVEIFKTQLEDCEGYELLENNQDEFVFWIRYYETPEKFQITQMRYKFTLNTTIQNYISFMRDLQLQKQLDSSVDQFESHYSDEGLQINYLRYKKILFMDPRDFLYIKYTKFIDEDTVIEISKSFENQDFQPYVPSTKSTTRAILLLSGNLIKQVEPNKIEILTFSECNMKLKLKPAMTKTASKNEIKKLIKKYRDHFNSIQ
ncbi:unnamed protein product (macronuclear) [Paramecium tetraurelia]|uniref:START domain-containing protein n=1 Tax=Paramecium tetraurelia TaxID=5888 RepID=A0CQR4_PARTE|nr:uncharacterized protein GSPATT00009479001 [Paramecium tetraurelia]CAK73131.1 unnamed protein product [Paramecium tetraurelia]|eukprot:XP_001440528.1 hypothetical protein (macronuclear) [Paramecium tetraurelia strain d4-2]